MNKTILYVTSSLPSVTLTFVYREIEVLKKAGYNIETVSRLKPDKNSISPEASYLYDSTLYLDQASLISKCLCQLLILFRMPKIWIKNIWLSITEKEVQNFRDRLRLLKQLLDAGYAYIKLEKRNFQHIHAHFLSGPTSVACFLSNYFGIPFSFTMHASLIFTDPIMLRTKLEMCSRAVTISKYNKTYLAKKYGRKLINKVDIIHCGIDPSVYNPVNGSKPQPPIILAVGQLAERKGFLYLVEAFKILAKKQLSFTGYIIGQGDQWELLRCKIKEYGIDHIVKLLGRQPQEFVRKQLNEASIFTLPSIVTDFGGREGIPVALMEAMAMKLPVISTKSVGIPELIEHGKDGILVEERAAEELSAAIEHLLRNPQERIRLGVAARKKVLHEYNLNNIPDGFRRVFC